MPVTKNAAFRDDQIPALRPLEDISRVLRWDQRGDAALAGLSEQQWDALARSLGRRRLLGLLSRRLDRARGSIAPPPAIAALLREMMIRVAARHLAACQPVAACLSETGTQAMLLKGSDLAQRYYGNVGQRRMVDIDLLVRPDEVAGLDAALRLRGFTAPFTAEAVRLSSEHHISYQPPPGGRIVEVHWRLSRRVGRDIDLDGIWLRSKPASLLGAPVRVMAAEDLLPYLCSHLAHHLYWTSFNQIWDLAEVVIHTGADFDGEACRRNATTWGLAHMMDLALDIMTTTLHPPWSPPWPMVEVPCAIRDVALGELDRHFRGLPASVGDGRALDLMVGDPSWSARLGLFRHAILPPPSELAIRLGLSRRPTSLARGYLVLWGQLLTRRGMQLRQWLGGDRGFRRTLRRMARLRSWLDG